MVLSAFTLQVVFESSVIPCGGIIRFRICHLEFVSASRENMRNDQPGIFFVIGGNNMHGAVVVLVALRQASYAFHIMLPLFSFLRRRRGWNSSSYPAHRSCEKRVRVFFFERWKEDLMIRVRCDEDVSPIHDGTISSRPKLSFRPIIHPGVPGLERIPDAHEQWAPPHNRTIEDSDFTAFRQAEVRAPKKSCFRSPYLAVWNWKPRSLPGWRRTSGAWWRHLSGSVHTLEN